MSKKKSRLEKLRDTVPNTLEALCSLHYIRQNALCDNDFDREVFELFQKSVNKTLVLVIEKSNYMPSISEYAKINWCF